MACATPLLNGAIWPSTPSRRSGDLRPTEPQPCEMAAYNPAWVTNLVFKYASIASEPPSDP
jgi:hypothetical protein